MKCYEVNVEQSPGCSTVYVIADSYSEAEDTVHLYVDYPKGINSIKMLGEGYYMPEKINE